MSQTRLALWVALDKRNRPSCAFNIPADRKFSKFRPIASMFTSFCRAPAAPLKMVKADRVRRLKAIWCHRKMLRGGVWATKLNCKSSWEAVAIPIRPFRVKPLEAAVQDLPRLVKAAVVRPFKVCRTLLDAKTSGWIGLLRAGVAVLPVKLWEAMPAISLSILTSSIRKALQDRREEMQAKAHTLSFPCRMSKRKRSEVRVALLKALATPPMHKRDLCRSEALPMDFLRVLQHSDRAEAGVAIWAVAALPSWAMSTMNWMFLPVAVAAAPLHPPIF